MTRDRETLLKRVESLNLRLGAHNDNMQNFRLALDKMLDIEDGKGKPDENIETAEKAVKNALELLKDYIDEYLESDILSEHDKIHKESIRSLLIIYIEDIRKCLGFNNEKAYKSPRKFI